MKAVFNPGPSYFNPEVRKYAGWTRILDLMKEALESLRYEVCIPEVPAELVDTQTTVSKITSWDLVAASQLPADVDLFLGPPGYSLAQILRLNGKAKVVTYVWNNADWWRDQQLAEEYQRTETPYDLSPTWRWINRTALQLSDRVIACSPWVKMTHAKVVPEDRISIAFWGVDSQRFTPDWEWQKKSPLPLRVLFVGSDPVRKGLLYLIRAIRELDGVEGTIVGCNVEFNVDVGRVTAIGMVPNERMPEIMKEHHVICIPTLEDGIACSIQEGMASGLVPIATPEAAEVFEHEVSGFRVDYKDVDGIRERVVWLRDHLEKRAQMALAARTLAVSQTWGRFQEEFANIIRKEVSGSG